MKKILDLEQAQPLAKNLRKEGKTTVLTGGCFDILHLGHIKFLTAAKKQGEVLMVALESDENVKKLKGAGRPINTQKVRAEILSALEMVNYVILLPLMDGHADYFSLVQNLKPAVIAVTAGDPHLKQKQKQAQIIGAVLKVVTTHLESTSTSRLVKILGLD